MADQHTPNPVDLSTGAGGLCHAIAAGLPIPPMRILKIARGLAFLSVLDPAALAAIGFVVARLSGGFLPDLVAMQGGRP